MTANLFLVAASLPNFGRTVIDAVDLSEFDPPPEVRREFDEDEPTRIWGTRKGGGNRQQYAEMDPDDRLLFYDAGAYVAAGRVGKTFSTPWVSRTFWGYAPMELLYSVEDFREVDALAERVDDELGLDDDFEPEGLHRVDDDRVASLLDDHGSFEAFVDALDED